MNLEGRIIGNRYEILEKIGNGGMATVYKAQDTILKRYVAVKVLKEEFTTDEEFIRRFNTEAQSAASLTHPNIVSIYDVGTEENVYYIVMELIQGKTLKEIIDEDGVLPWKWSLDIAIQIASALEVAHKNHIVHRDIKPHNIIITEDGVAKVTDFGIAKAVSNSTITAFGTTIGSVHYFSPEHARGGYTDAKSDLYSLGVVMYEMVTGKVPFDADTPVSVALKHMQEEAVEPRTVNPNVPEAVNKIIMKALQKEPVMRYQTATEMLQDLKMSLKNPSGDFVDESTYDPTAVTQKISLNDYEKEAKNQGENANKKKDGKFKTFIKKHKGLSIFIGLILLFFIAFGGTLAFLNITNPAEVLLPNFVGMSREEAQSNADESKLVLEVTSEEYNSEVPEGYIISQDPKYVEDYNVKEGSTVKIVISKGAEKTKVPKVTGMTEEEAVKALEDANLKAEITEETSEKVEAGYVISQDIEAETEIETGETIKITVSKGTGIKQVEVTSVIGQTEESAKTTLTNLGLKVNVTYEEDSSKENGVVLRQSVSSGEKVNEGTTITLTVNKVAETKTANITINVKSITGGYTEDTTSDEEENQTQTPKVDKTVKIVVTVDGTEVYTDSNVDKNTTNKQTSISGKGTVTVKVTITDNSGGSWTRTQSINLNTTSELTFS